MKFRLLLLGVLCGLLFTGCGRELTDAELLQRDREELAELLNTNKILSYKFVKLCIRASLKPEESSAELVAFKSKGDPLFARMIRADAQGGELSVTDYIGLYRDFLTLKGYVRETDEDIFPCVTEVLVEAYGGDSLGFAAGDTIRIVGLRGGNVKFGGLDRFKGTQKVVLQNVEHAALSGLVLLSKDFGRSIALYECAETETAVLPDGEPKTLLNFFRGFIFFQEGLLYLSEQALTENLAWLDAHPKVELPWTYLAFQWGGLDQKQTHIAFHAMNHLLRGLDRLLMERDIDEKRALQDLEAFVKDAEKIGLDNEVVWMVQAYLYMKQEESEKAIVALKKLKGSALLGEDEKEVMDETIGYLEEREPDEALNGVYDHVFMGKVMIYYTLAKLAEVDWKKLMLENDIPHTAEIYATIERMEGVIKGIDQYTSTDELAEVGKEVGKGIR
jgi:tetratricopeptide (TPR) repeat protein